MTPAVKGMQKAHCLFFIITWAALHNRADQHFDQSVIGVEVEDKTGNLNDLLLTLKDSNVSVDYLYLSFNRDSGKPIMVFHTEDTMEVRACLKSRGYTVL